MHANNPPNQLEAWQLAIASSPTPKTTPKDIKIEHIQQKKKNDDFQLGKQTSPTPKIFNFYPDNIPQSLKAIPRWSPWKASWNLKRGKWDKIPQLASNPDYGLSTAKPERWVDYDQAIGGFDSGKSAGLGFCMTGYVGLVAIDLDNCYQEPWALAIITQVNSYTEISPSGKGYRIFAFGQIDVDWNNHNVGIEVYGGNEARFLTVTGELIGECTDVMPVSTDVLENLFKRYAREKRKAEVIDLNMPDLIDPPVIEDLRIPEGPRQFLLTGEFDGDRSGSLFGVGVCLYAAGYSDEEVFSILAMNDYAMEVALDHRRQDQDRALLYLWREHCIKAKGKASASVASADEFDELLPLNEDQDLSKFDRSNNGRIKQTKENVIRALQNNKMTGIEIRFDAFKGEIMISPTGKDEWRAFQDTDYIELSLILEKGTNGFVDIRRERMRECLAYVAKQNEFDSAILWISSLKWDGIQRIETFIPRYFGAEDTPYTRAIGVYIWSALAGRLLEPGIKADMVPVVVGAQGSKKSSSVAAMAPSPDFFLELDIGGKDDDISRLIRNKLIIELAELKGLRRRDLEHVKSVITKQYEEWTPKFKEMNTRYARRCLFIGTTNSNEFLEDDTGHRRWLPFDAGECDPDGITIDREQLWAESRDVFNSHGIQWQEVERLAKVEHEKYVEIDAWKESVKEWLITPELITGGRPIENKEGVTAVEALKGAFYLNDMNLDKRIKDRMASVLKSLGGLQKRTGTRRSYYFEDLKKDLS